MNEFCLRNQRAKTKLEADLKETARLQEEERKKIEIENEKNLVELIKEINSQIFQSEIKNEAENHMSL